MTNAKHTTILLTFLLISSIAISTTVFAQIPPLIRYQGKLNDSQGVPLEGPYNLTFRIYDVEASGEPLWTETQGNVPITQGFFNVLLGQVTALDLPFDKTYWLSIQVDGDEEMVPRQQVTSVSYAFRAKTADSVDTIAPTSVNPQGAGSGLDADMVDGYDASDLMDLSQQTGTVALDAIPQGSGSGLHADLLDNQHGSFYLTLANHTGILPVSQGGTGATTLTDGGILLGSGTGAITPLGVASNGQIPIGDGTTDPVLATITAVANETEVTNGPGTITIGIVDPLVVAKGGTGSSADKNTANGVVILDASGYVPDNSVDTSALKTAVSEVSRSTSGTQDFIITGGQYCFYPQIDVDYVTEFPAGWWSIFHGPGDSPIVPHHNPTTNITIHNANGAGILRATTRYVTSSGQDYWLWLLLDKSTKDIISASAASDAPAYGNGGDFEKVPHPFTNFDPDTQEIILIDQDTCKTVCQEAKNTGKSVLELVDTEYKVDFQEELQYTPLHSGKYIDEDGKQIKEMVTSIPDYIKVRRLVKLTEQEKTERELKRQKAQELFQQQEQERKEKLAALKQKLNLDEEELELLRTLIAP